MAKPSQKPRGTENDARVAKPRHACRAADAVMRLARDKWGARASLELAMRTAADDPQNGQRNAQRWLAGGSMSVDNFADLVRADIGPDVIASIMGDEPKLWPAWYADYRRQLGIAALHRSLTRSRRDLDALMAADV